MRLVRQARITAGSSKTNGRETCPVWCGFVAFPPATDSAKKGRHYFVAEWHCCLRQWHYFSPSGTLSSAIRVGPKEYGCDVADLRLTGSAIRLPWLQPGIVTLVLGG